LSHILQKEHSPGNSFVGAGIEVYSGGAIFYQEDVLEAAVGAGTEVQSG
jgi:hypothetical protein